MRTREPILTHGRDNWDTVNMPVDAFQTRVERVRGVMERERIDVLLIYGSGDRDGDIAYVSNLIHKVPGFPLGLVVTADTVVVINQRSSRTRPIVERSTWADDVRFTRNLWGDVTEVLAEVAERGDSISLVGGDAMSHADFEAMERLDDAWSIEVRDGFLDSLRSVKDERERDQIRRAGRILGAVETVLSEPIDSPTRERKFVADLDRIARLHGAQDVRVLVSNPTHTEGAHRPAEDLPIETTNPISIYVAARFEGYWASFTRTTTLDGADVGSADCEAIEGVLDELIESLEPGRDAAAVVQDAITAIEGLGLELDDRYDVLSNVGLELDEPPILGAGEPASELPIEPGHCFEATLAIAGGNPDPILVGETVVVTEDGPERVTGGIEL